MAADEHLDDGRSFEELFSSLDGITASDELKEGALSAIFAEMDAEEARAEFTVHEGGKTSHTLPKAKPRHLGRVAAAVLVAILATGSVAYATPVQSISVTEGDESIELGVNVFGVAVRASADSEEIESLLDDAGIRGVGYEEAMGRAIDCLASRGVGDGSVAVQIEGGIADQRDRADAAAERAIESRGKKRGEGGAAATAEPAFGQAQPADEEPQEPQAQGEPAPSGAGEPVGQDGPAAGQPPMQDPSGQAGNEPAAPASQQGQGDAPAPSQEASKP